MEAVTTCTRGVGLNGSRSSSRISSAVAAASRDGDSAIGLGFTAEGVGTMGTEVSMLGRLTELVSEAEVATEEERARLVGIWDGLGEATPGVVGRLPPSERTDDVLRIAVPIRERIDFGGVLVDIFGPRIESQTVSSWRY